MMGNMLKLWAYELSKEGIPQSMFQKNFFIHLFFGFRKIFLSGTKRNTIKRIRFFPGIRQDTGLSVKNN